MRLRKRDVEALFVAYDADPRQALARALRVVLGRPEASFDELVVGLPDADALRAGDLAASDALARRLAEERSL